MQIIFIVLPCNMATVQNLYSDKLALGRSYLKMKLCLLQIFLYLHLFSCLDKIAKLACINQKLGKHSKCDTRTRARACKSYEQHVFEVS